MVLMLKHCCCGCTLKTGALIIAVVFAILSALDAVLFCITAVESATQLYYYEKHMEAASDPYEHTDSPGPTIPVTIAATAMPISSTTTEDYDEDDGYGDEQLSFRMKLLYVWKWISILLVILECAGFALSVFLMFAANKDSGRYVFVWVAGFTVVTCCRLVLHLISQGIIIYAGAVIAGLFFMAITVSITVGSAYSALVGYSYYRQLVGTGVARRISQQED